MDTIAVPEKPDDHPCAVLKACRGDPSALAKVDPCLLNNKTFILSMIRANPRQLADPVFGASSTLDFSALAFASHSLQSDHEVVHAAVIQNGLALRHASETCKDDVKLVSAAVKQNGFAIYHASKKLQMDPSLVRDAVLNHPKAFEIIDESFRDDEKLMTEVIGQRETPSFDLFYASDRLKSNKALVLLAVSRSGQLIKHASQELRSDLDVIKKAIINDPNALEFIHHLDFSDWLSVVLICVQTHQCLPQRNMPTLWLPHLLISEDDKKQVLAILEHHGLALSQMPRDYQSNRDFVLTALKQNGLVLQWTSDYQSDPEAIALATTQTSMALRYANSHAITYQLVEEMVTQNGMAFVDAPGSRRDDPNLAHLAISRNPAAIKAIGISLRKNRNFVDQAIHANPLAFIYLDSSWHENSRLQQSFLNGMLDPQTDQHAMADFFVLNINAWSSHIWTAPWAHSMNCPWPRNNAWSLAHRCLLAGIQYKNWPLVQELFTQHLNYWPTKLAGNDPLLLALQRAMFQFDPFDSDYRGCYDCIHQAVSSSTTDVSVHLSQLVITFTRSLQHLLDTLHDLRIHEEVLHPAEETLIDGLWVDFFFIRNQLKSLQSFDFKFVNPWLYRPLLETTTGFLQQLSACRLRYPHPQQHEPHDWHPVLQSTRAILTLALPWITRLHLPHDQKHFQPVSTPIKDDLKTLSFWSDRYTTQANNQASNQSSMISI